VPWLITAVMCLIMGSVFQQAQLKGQQARRLAAQRRGIAYRPHRPPGSSRDFVWLWLPVGMASVMGVALRWSRETRPLHHAALAGDLDGVRERLERGVDPDTEDPYTGWTPLIWAIKEQHIHVVRLLLERGADPNRPARRGRTPLIWSASRGAPEAVKLLLLHGAEANLASEGTTALVEGAPFVEVVQALLDAGADPNARTAGGMTALIKAAEWPGWSHEREAEAVESIGLLLTHGAEIDARDDKGRTALKVATERRRARLVEALRQAGAKEESDPAQGG
jgi:ankyrin repeat protein